ncbi:MAG: arsenate reductase ArsC [Acidobacteriales bacterium]|nr:arsenate reductase ArsC [Terriglobales bacterium]
MAAAFFNALAEGKGARAISAGTTPAIEVHPVVVQAMRELGIDLSQAQPQRLTPELAASAQMLVTMGCGEDCPFVPGLEVVEWQISDPKDQPLERAREIRDDILEQVKVLLLRMQ